MARNEERVSDLLEVTGVSVSFARRSVLLHRRVGAINAVRDVSLSIAVGETLALVGESGSGKSTLARSIVRLVRADAGTVKFEGANVLTANRRQLHDMRRRLQVVFQNPYSSLNPRMRIGEIVGEPLLVHGVASAAERRLRVSEMLDRVGLAPDAAGRFPPDFSGGQRQRLAIARALVLRPSLVICDEAVSSLDASVQGQIIRLLQGLQADLGVAFLFITHDFDVAREIAHRTAVMHRGEIVEVGTTRQILTEPANSYTRALVAAIPRPEFSQGKAQIRPPLRKPSREGSDS